MSTSPSQFRVLTRHFVGQFLDNDLLSPREGLQAGFAGALGFLLMLTLFIPIRLALKYGYPFETFAQRDYASWGDKCQFIALTMIVLGGLALTQWHTLRLDRRDYYILLPLPVPHTTILWAKLAALVWLFTVFAAALAGFGPVFSVVLFASGHPALVDAVRWALGHVTAILAAGAFAYFGVLALHGTLFTVLGPRAFGRAGPWVQAAGIFVVALAVLLLPLITWSTYPLKRAGGPGLHAMPTMWFLGLYQTVGGRTDADFRGLALLGLWTPMAAVAIAALTSLLGYRRHIATTIESLDTRTPRPLVRRIGARLVAAACGWRPLRHAIFSFMARTLTRSPRHRAVMTLAFSVACAVAAVSLLSSASSSREGWRPPDAGAVLSIQYALTFFLVLAARFATVVPSELRAGWMPRLLAPRDAAPLRAGAARAVLACGVAPLVAVLLPIDAALVGWRLAGAHAVIGLVTGAALIELAFFGFASIPFTFALPPDTGLPRARWLGYWLGFSFFVLALPQLEALALGQPGGFSWFAGVGLGLLVTLVVIRRISARGGTPTVFEEQGDWAVQRLDLSA
jgi:hypothetical protein